MGSEGDFQRKRVSVSADCQQRLRPNLRGCLKDILTGRHTTGHICGVSCALLSKSVPLKCLFQKNNSYGHFLLWQQRLSNLFCRAPLWQIKHAQAPTFGKQRSLVNCHCQIWALGFSSIQSWCVSQFSDGGWKLSIKADPNTGNY